MVVKIMVPIKGILGFYWGYIGDNGKENGNYYSGLYRDYRVYRWLSKLWSPFWIPLIIRHLIFRVLKKDHNFDNHPCPPMLTSSFRIRFKVYGVSAGELLLAKAAAGKSLQTF